jgi:SpoVK/Ycf46/Vps4 family AAA+-type ATPase
MTSGPEQLRSLEQALDESPENVTLRLMVAQGHLDLANGDSGRVHAETALTHAKQVLGSRPDSVEVLEVAVGAAVLAGESDLAGRYQRLLDGLGSARPITESSGVSWAPDGSHDDIEGEEPLWLSTGDQGELAADFDGTELTEIDVPSVRLDDVGGLEEVKRRLKTSFLGPMQNPELRAMYRTSLQGGMLLYGPPGCGKTFLARAIAGELAAQFASIGLHDVLDMWLGQSEQKLHAVFENARRHAPCVLFLDEVDAIGMKRSNLTHSAGRNVVVQLLTEMDGMGSDNEGVFVIGATNQPWDVDPALRRPGRFDRVLLVQPPDRPARESILTYHLRERPLDERIDVRRLAGRTEQFSGADLRLVCDSAAEIALEESMASGRARPIMQRDLERAVKEVHPSTRAWFEVAKNFAQFSNEGGRYDDLLDYMRDHKLL